MGRFKLLAPTLLVLLVVSGILLMHGFESVSPESLATHTQHDVDGADAAATVAGFCVFVIALVAAAAADNLAMSTTVAHRPQTRRWTTRRSAGRKPPLSSFYELCVMRV